MDLNDLFYRQQIERSLAAAAQSEPTRKLHEDLAGAYEVMINQVSGGSSSLFRWTHPTGEPPLNSTMAVAMTAREVGIR
jgi:hypothetical protein